MNEDSPVETKPMHVISKALLFVHVFTIEEAYQSLFPVDGPVTPVQVLSYFGDPDPQRCGEAWALHYHGYWGHAAPRFWVIEEDKEFTTAKVIRDYLEEMFPDV